jgi:hypothetical protein
MIGKSKKFVVSLMMLSAIQPTGPAASSYLTRVNKLLEKCEKKLQPPNYSLKLYIFLAVLKKTTEMIIQNSYYPNKGLVGVLIIFT